MEFGRNTYRKNFLKQLKEKNLEFLNSSVGFVKDDEEGAKLHTDSMI